MRSLEEQNASALAALMAHHGPTAAPTPKPRRKLVYRRHIIRAPMGLVATQLVERPAKAQPILMTDRILDAVTKETGVSLSEIRGPRRERRVVTARWAAAWLMRKHCTNMSLPAIGRRLGKRDHSTVVHALKGIAADPVRFAPIIEAVEARL